MPPINWQPPAANRADNYDSIKDNPDIDIIYVVLPNSMHAGYTNRACPSYWYLYRPKFSLQDTLIPH